MSDKRARTAHKVAVWDILVNDAGEVLIALDAREEEAANARIVPHGQQGLILARNARDAVFLDPVPEGLRRRVLAQTEVLVAETDPGGIVRDYVARVARPG